MFEQRRTELGYADYLGALQLYRVRRERDARLLSMSSSLVDYPFADRLYPRTLEVMRHLRWLGLTVILSDGDVVFQPQKVERSGLWDAVEGRVLIYIHKEKRPDAVTAAYPARSGSTTHDSVARGEDGPTHPPMEQIASFRAMPTMTLIRPANAPESVEARRGTIPGVSDLGASAVGPEIIKHFGFTVEHVVAATFRPLTGARRTTP